ncbi:uncharacterized protein LOC108089296 [Drosophila ficusphila]|uniref:uncharacterized protein LOC108089296 n=1 Tax=Drosophila ficusphila TaxID=30025 RepID=UPI0007E63587|nr:uncharacterized protein LOC108089296 [Drosophila ficusphila]
MRMFFCIFTILGSLTTVFPYVTFTNLKCITKDVKFAKFEKCYIKAVNRTHKYLDIHANMYKKSINNVSVNVKLMRYDHGYRPFFVDLHIDVCKFLKNPRIPIAKLFFDIYKNNSNINHTCPYNHDIIIDHVYTGNLESNIFKYIPLRSGDFAIYSEWSVYNIVRSLINVYVRVSEKQE